MTAANVGSDGGGESAAARLAAAHRHVESKNFAAAIGDAQRAVQLPDCTLEQRIEAGEILAAADDKAKGAEVLLDAGTRALYDMGDMAKAKATFARAHQVDPSNLDVLFQMGQADVVDGRTQDALAKFIDVLRKSNLKHIPALFEAGCLYQASGQHDQAILAFKKVLDREKSHVQAIVHMGQLHQTKGMVPEALTYYMQAADMARESGQFGTALQLCSMVLALDSHNQKARFMIDDLNDRGQDQDEAPAADLVKTVHSHPVLARTPPAATASARSAAPPAAQPPTAAQTRALEELTAQQAQLKQQIDELAGTRLDAELAAAQAKDAVEAATMARDSAVAAKGKAQAELAAIIETLEQQRLKSQAELAAIAESAGQQKGKAQADLEALTASIEQQKAHADEAARRKAEVEAQLAAANATLAETKRAEAEASASAERRRTELELQLSELAARCEDAEAAVRKLGADRTAGQEAATAAAAASTRAQQELEALAQRQADARAQAGAAAEERDRARAEAAAAAAELSALLEQVKSAGAGAADAKKVRDASAKLKELEGAVQAAAAKLAETNVAIESADTRKAEAEAAYARAKSLAAAAEEKRADAARLAEQAEALRTKREADAEALASRIAGLENAAKEADGKAKALAAESATLGDVSAKVAAQRTALDALEAKRDEIDVARKAADDDLTRVRAELQQSRAELETTRAAVGSAVEQQVSGEQRRRATDESYAEVVAATVPPQACAESLRTIEMLAAEGEVPFDIAAELAGLIHEGRAVEALRVARARANLDAHPAPYMLAVGDLARDLGDATGAREAYRIVASVDAAKSGLVQQRLGQLFLTFADKGTAAALARDDAHYALEKEPAKALEAYAELVARFPADANFRQELGEVHERLGNQEAAGLAFSQAMTQYLAGDDAAKAVELVPHVLVTRPGSGAALELAAKAYERAGMQHEACKTLDDALAAYRSSRSAADIERVCRRLAEIADDPVPYRRELAALLRDVGDIGGAAEQLLEAAEKLIKWSNAADALAVLREAAALAGEAEPLRDRIADAKERAANAQGSVDAASRAATFLAKKQYEKAVDAYRTAVDKNPYNADACYQLACLLSDQFPDLATAEQLLENAAELRPGHTATRYRMALVKAGRGDVEEAVELLVALARFDENNADFIEQFVERLERDADGGSTAAKYRLGIAYRELGRVEEALVILQSIQRETEFIVLCLNAIGLCLRRQGLDTAAAKRFQKAIEMPGYPETQYNEALYNLGDLYEVKRDPESLALSLSSFEELYARDCTFRDVADRIKSVKAKLGSAEGPKVKRLPNRSEAASDR